MRLGSSEGEKIKKAVCMYMLTAFFISFLLILVDNSLVDDNVGAVILVACSFTVNVNNNAILGSSAVLVVVGLISYFVIYFV